MVRNMEKDKTVPGSELLKQITILDAIYWVSHSWTDVEESTIVKCFAKAGFKSCEVPVSLNDKTDECRENSCSAAECDDSDDDVPLAVLRMSQELFGCNFNELVKLDQDYSGNRLDRIS